MEKDEYYLKKTFESAGLSNYKRETGKSVKIAASIYNGNEIISINVNQNKTHPKQYYYNKYLDHTKVKCNLHAEMAAIISAYKKVKGKDLKHLSMYVARELCNGKYGYSRPCEACMRAIKDSGIKKVVYTTEFGYATEYIK